MSSVRCIYCDSLCFAADIVLAHTCGNHKIPPHFHVGYTYNVSLIYFHINYNYDFYNNYTICVIPNKYINVYLRSELILNVPYLSISPENAESVLLKLLKLKSFS